MNCQNCGTFNNINSKFCIKCGSNLSTQQVFNQNSSYKEVPNQNINLNNTNSTSNEFQQNNFNQIYEQNNINSTFNNNYSSEQVINKISFIQYFFIMISVILKPFTTFKEELNKFNNFKNSAILSLIISIFATLISLIKTMIDSVRVTSYFSDETEWVWENLKELDYIQLIGKNFLIYLGIIVAIAAIYYISSLIAKKQVSFSRLLGISALAIVPLLICFLVISPLLNMIWEELAMPVNIIGILYSFVILYEGINSEILLEGNAKYYFNLICFSILGILAYYLYMKIFMSAATSGLNDLLDLFN